MGYHLTSCLAQTAEALQASAAESADMKQKPAAQLAHVPSLEIARPAGLPRPPLFLVININILAQTPTASSSLKQPVDVTCSSQGFEEREHYNLCGLESDVIAAKKTFFVN